jgi:exopolyphosphatase / guanosine-5'-triphosphate,3'-diphosphate pyrophosphatase
MRLGVLDIGSNSAQLQVMDIREGAPPLPTHAVKHPTLLGEAFESDGSIGTAGVDRVVGAVAATMEAARGLDVRQLYVFVTSAVRDATNRELVIARIEREAGIRPQFLSGAQEARLTYLAARRWYGWSAGRLLLLDIGGGSMEVVLGRDSEPELAVSLRLGAGRMTRAYFAQDPPGRVAVKTLRRHVRGELREVADRLRWESVPARVVATSKTFTQLARLAGAAAQREGPFVPRSLRVADLDRLIPQLAKVPASERAKLRGVSKARSRQILAGALIARVAMRELDVSIVDICPWALREGVLLRHLQTVDDPARRLPLNPVDPDADAAEAPAHRPTGRPRPG